MLQHTVGITESTDQTFTNLSDKDYALEGGLVASIQCGKKSIQPMTKPKTTLNKSLLPLNIDSSTDCLEYSKALNFMNTYKKRPFGKEVNEKAFFKLITQYIHQKKKKGTFKVDETYFDELNGQYIAYRKIFREWDISVRGNFSRREQLSIMGMLAYLENRLNGFGHRNDELHYACVRKEDVSGKLFEEATRGFEFSRLYIPLCPLVCYLEIVRNLKCCRK
jgi:hypothetical protein